MLHLDTGNTAFMLLCSSLVMLMTPGLAFFYGGLVGRKNVLAIMIQSFVSMGWTTVIWWTVGVSMCFSGDLKSGTDLGGLIGNFHWAFMRGITLDMPSPINDSIPMIVDRRRHIERDPSHECPMEVADETPEVRAALKVSRETHREPHGPPDHRRPSHGDEALNHDGQDVLTAHQAPVEESQAWSHEHHQARAQEHEC